MITVRMMGKVEEAEQLEKLAVAIEQASRLIGIPLTFSNTLQVSADDAHKMRALPVAQLPATTKPEEPELEPKQVVEQPKPVASRKQPITRLIDEFATKRGTTGPGRGRWH